MTPLKTPARTALEAEVLRLRAGGMATPQIGRRLGISKNATCGIIARERARHGHVATPRIVGPHARRFKQLPAPPVPVGQAAVASPQNRAVPNPKLAPVAAVRPAQRPAPFFRGKCQRPLWGHHMHRGFDAVKADPLFGQLCGKPVARIGTSWCEDCRGILYSRAAQSEAA